MHVHKYTLIYKHTTGMGRLMVSKVTYLLGFVSDVYSVLSFSSERSGTT